MPIGRRGLPYEKWDHPLSHNLEVRLGSHAWRWTNQVSDRLAKNRRLEAQILPIRALTDGMRESMFGLYYRYYEATSRERFLADLAAKDEALILYDTADVIRGFSTLRLIECEWNGHRCRVVFSGDTIVHHRFWGEQSLAFNWIRRAGAIKAERPNAPLFWLLIVKGHRTFRYLQAFSRNYYPHWKADTPPDMQGLMDRLGADLFGEDYGCDKGIVSFPLSRGQLRPEWAEPPDEVMSRPEVRFFLHRNPGYRQGDELLCLTELTPENLRPLARRLFEAGMGE